MPLRLVPPATSDPSDQVTPIINTSNPAPTYVLLSFLSFILTKRLLGLLAPPEAKVQGPTTVWKWVNTANSMVHSCVTGVGAVLCVYAYPQITLNVISTYSEASHRLVCYSVGYFIFDLADMALNHRKRSSYELMAHHFFVLACFILSITTRYYLAFTIISLVVEVNSIFLHWRQLLVITRTPKSTLAYRSVSFLNLATFLLFRITTLAWMCRWLALHSHLVYPAPYALGCVCILALMTMSIVLFVRLLKSDLAVVCGEDNHHHQLLPTNPNNDNNNSDKDKGQ